MQKNKGLVTLIYCYLFFYVVIAMFLLLFFFILLLADAGERGLGNFLTRKGKRRKEEPGPLSAGDLWSLNRSMLNPFTSLLTKYYICVCNFTMLTHLSTTNLIENW